jgi:hypothetical protein
VLFYITCPCLENGHVIRKIVILSVIVIVPSTLEPDGYVLLVLSIDGHHLEKKGQEQVIRKKIKY